MTGKLSSDKPRVYICRNGFGEVIYVGVTAFLRDRFIMHKSASPWWCEVQSVSSEGRAESRAAGQRLERDLIKRYRPRYNKQHNPDWLGFK